MMQRIGIMGGMFDPVHTGHLQVARAALQALELDHIFLVPCAMPNHREQPGASQAHRRAMLELAIGNDSRLSIDEREFRRQGVSYAIDTLQSFAREFPDGMRVYVLGWDSFNSLPSWHRWRELFNYSHFCAVSRPGETLPKETRRRFGRPENIETDDNRPAPGSDSTLHNQALLLAELKARRVASVQDLLVQPSGGILVLEDVYMPVSSAAVRQALAHGTPVNQVPAAVLVYIQEHKLYQSPTTP